MMVRAHRALGKASIWVILLGSLALLAAVAPSPASASETVSTPSDSNAVVVSSDQSKLNAGDTAWMLT
ncbi:MAG TPA: hypothetical protein VFW23_02785, partial [Tepidisphaeraceae bacterium]|nr:hypothetical protein [Tepidisphaeraceae bacterium]